MRGVLIRVSVELVAYVHATESQEKVSKAIERCVPADLIGELSWSIREVEGHFGNPIVIMRSEARGGDLPERVISHIAQGLGLTDRERVSHGINQYINEKGILSFRLDKQSAYMGELALSPADAVVVRVRVQPRGGITAAEAIKGLLSKAGLGA